MNPTTGKLRAILERGPVDNAALEETRALARSQESDVSDGLAALLRDPDPRVAEAAADVIARLSSERAHDAVVADAMAELTDPTGATKLPGPGWRRLQAVGPAVLPALARAYRGERSAERRLAMIHIAQQMGDPAGLALLEAAVDDLDSRLAQAAGEALGALGGDAAYARLVRLLGSGDAQRRLGAIHGLRRLGDPLAVEPLLRLLTQEDRPCAQWWPGAIGEATTLHGAAAEAIDALTGERLNGDVAAIRTWIAERRPS